MQLNIIRSDFPDGKTGIRKLTRVLRKKVGTALEKRVKKSENCFAARDYYRTPEPRASRVFTSDVPRSEQREGGGLSLGKKIRHARRCRAARTLLSSPLRLSTRELLRAGAS